MDQIVNRSYLRVVVLGIIVSNFFYFFNPHFLTVYAYNQKKMLQNVMLEKDIPIHFEQP